MALSQSEHDIIKTTKDQVGVLYSKAVALMSLLEKITARTDPADPLATNETFAATVATYSPLYTALKADIQTAFTALP